MKLKSFKDLLIEELRDIYDAEQQLVKALPSVADAVILPELKRAFAQHLDQTTVHVERLERIFLKLKESPHGNPCKTMAGLIAEAEDVVAERRKADPGVIDAALIAAAQKVEHFEIAAYGTARTYAQTLGLPEIAALLQQTLAEEGEANQLLNEIAIRSVNPEAAEATSEAKKLKEAVVSVLEVATH